MSEYTTQEILKLIEENDGPEGLDLSGVEARPRDFIPRRGFAIQGGDDIGTS